MRSTSRPCSARSPSSPGDMGATLSATVVTNRTDPAELERALASLAAAVAEARRRGLVSGAALFVVNNGADAKAPAIAAEAFDAGVRVLQGHGNVGYGRANNLALPQLRS